MWLLHALTTTQPWSTTFLLFCAASICRSYTCPWYGQYTSGTDIYTKHITWHLPCYPVICNPTWAIQLSNSKILRFPTVSILHRKCGPENVQNNSQYEYLPETTNRIVLPFLLSLKNISGKINIKWIYCSTCTFSGFCCQASKQVSCLCSQQQQIYCHLCGMNWWRTECLYHNV